MRPNSNKSTSVWVEQKNKIRQITAPAVRAHRFEMSQNQNHLTEHKYEQPSYSFNKPEILEPTIKEPIMTLLEPVLIEAGEDPTLSLDKIEIIKPKYLDSKLITRNQSKSKLGGIEIVRLNNLNDDMKMIDGDLRSMTLKGGDYVELTTEQQTPNLLSQQSPRMKSLKRIFINKP